MNEQFYMSNLPYYEIPTPVKTVLAVFGAHGYRAYIVGGAVRDIMRGAPVHDWDVATETPPELTKQLFCEYPVYDTGLKHGTVTVNVDGELIEITTFRTDGEYKDSRHPENVMFTDSLYEDLERRDFTINAMALNLYKDLEDPFRGMRDLANNEICAVGVPLDRFAEDALRIMRAYRFSATLLYTIEEKTLEATSICAYRLEYISRERINEEWKKILTAPFCSKAIVTMKKYGIFTFIFPGLKLDPEYLKDLEKLPPIYTLRSAAFFKNCPDEKFAEASSRINFTKNEATEVKSILEAYRSLVSDPDQSLRRFCYRYGKLAEYASLIAEHDLLVPARILPEIRAILSDTSMIWSRKDLKINGNDIISRYNLPRRSLSEITEALVLLVVDQKVENEREALLSAIENIIG